MTTFFTLATVSLKCKFYSNNSAAAVARFASQLFFSTNGVSFYPFFVPFIAPFLFYVRLSLLLTTDGTVYWMQAGSIIKKMVHRALACFPFLSAHFQHQIGCVQWHVIEQQEQQHKQQQVVDIDWDLMKLKFKNKISIESNKLHGKVMANA